MSIAARNAILAGGGGWKNPYVTDGLVAMWDGEWNAGPGVHDDLATGLKDLVGNHDLTLVGTCDWSGGYAALASGSYFKNESAKIDSGVGQIELAGQFKTANSLIGLSNNYAMGSYSGWVLCLARVGNNRYVSNDYAPFTLSVEYDVDCKPQKAYWRNVNRISNGGVMAKNLGDFISISDDWYTSQPTNFYSLRVYSKVLTDAERNANYAIDKERFNLT